MTENIAIKTDETAEYDIQSIDIQEIMELIPHRFPMLLIDRVEKVKLDHSAVGIKNVSMNEWYFQGHFPSQPVLPGVLIIEAMAQAAGVLVVKTMGVSGGNRLVYFMSVEEAKFRKPVLPGDVLELHVTKERHRGNVWKFKGEARVRGVLTDEATFTAMIVEQKA